MIVRTNRLRLRPLDVANAISWMSEPKKTSAMNTTVNHDIAPALGPLHLNIKIVPINTKIGSAERSTFIRLRSGPILFNIEYPYYFKKA